VHAQLSPVDTGYVFDVFWIKIAVTVHRFCNIHHAPGIFTPLTKQSNALYGQKPPKKLWIYEYISQWSNLAASRLSFFPSKDEYVPLSMGADLPHCISRQASPNMVLTRLRTCHSGLASSRWWLAREIQVSPPFPFPVDYGMEFVITAKPSPDLSWNQLRAFRSAQVP
jgi:hypothetical protein